MTEQTWSPQQQEAIDKVSAWLADKNRPQIFRLFGYAGTGKTTLAKHLAKGVEGTVLFACFTGKAAQVLRNKGCDGATTIHSLIYKAHIDYATGGVTFSKNYDSPLCEAKCLVVDEVSMVGEDLAKDLLSFKVPVLVLGDPAQLPPVKGAGFFIDAPPDVLLTEIHRQAAENPIIQASMEVRTGKWEAETYVTEEGGIVVHNRHEVDILELCLSHDQVLCGLNATRIAINTRIRRAMGRTNNKPVIGDRLVCLRNDAEKGLFNGSLWEVTKADVGIDRSSLRIKSLDEERPEVDVEVLNQFWNGTEKKLHWKAFRGTQQFTYGYVLTVHKAQGSQWDNVLLIDESYVFVEDARKHIYTGITRAARNLTVVV